MLGSRREAAIRQFIKAQGLKGQMAILRTQRQGQDWYVLLYGDYPSRAAANAAVAQLPAAVRAGKPWPRSFASVQADITNNP